MSEIAAHASAGGPAGGKKEQRPCPQGPPLPPTLTVSTLKSWCRAMSESNDLYSRSSMSMTCCAGSVAERSAKPVTSEK